MQRSIVIFFLFFPLWILPNNSTWSAPEPLSQSAPSIALQPWSYVKVSANQSIVDHPDDPSLQWLPFTNFGKSNPVEQEESLWLRTTLPEIIWDSPALFLRIEGIISDFYVDGQRVMQCTFEVCKGGGELAQMKIVTLPPLASRKTLLLQIRPVFENTGQFRFDHAQLGNQIVLLRHVIVESLGNVLVGILMIVLGLFLMIFYLANRQLNILAHFSFFSLTMGLFMLGRAGILSIDPALEEITQIISIGAFHLMPIGLLLFFRYLVPSHYHKFIRWQAIAHGIYALGAYIAIFFDMLTFADSLPPHFVLIMFTIAAMIFMGSKQRDPASRIFDLGISIFGVFGIHDMLITLGILPWHFFLTSIGLLSFLSCMGWVTHLHLADIRNRLRASSQKLEMQNQELQRMDQFKDEFLANTSHELRTPLNGIIGLIESMIDGTTGSLNEQQQANLSMVATSGKRLAYLVDDILDFSKLKSHDIQLQNKPLDFRPIAELVLQLSQPLLRGKVLELHNELPEELPAVYGDENRIQQILHNLLGNAIKFTHAGKITISGKKQGDQLEIAVTDSGIGIPIQSIEHIFDSFNQGDSSASREYGGTGLGLAVTKQLVELHGGTIGVQSKVGQGSQFHFTLPLSDKAPELSTILTKNITSAPETTPADLVPIESPSSAPTIGNFKILIVDDEPINLQVLLNYLSPSNFDVLQAVNGAEALKIFDEGQPPDLMLLDVMMPRMTGYEVCKKLRERFAANALPVILLTAKNQIGDLVTGFEAGANDFLSKPFSKQELLSRINTHLEVSQMSNAYARFVPREFLDILGKPSILNIQLGDQIRKNMTILFSDIRSFTSLSEKMEPETIFQFLNAYLEQAGPVIREHHGFIDKYIGDAIMALFEQSANDSVDAAISMLRVLATHNSSQEQMGRVPLQIGIGINTGASMLGTIGESHRMEGTVISDAVNIAARIESLTKTYQVSLLISEHTLASLNQPEQYQIRFIDRVQAKGKADFVSVYEVYDADPESIQMQKRSVAPHFEQGWKHFQAQEFVQAAPCFETCLNEYPSDVSSQIYLNQCKTQSNG